MVVCQYSTLVVINGRILVYSIYTSIQYTTHVLCSPACPPGSYGLRCAEHCSDCSNSSSCDPRDGHCEGKNQPVIYCITHDVLQYILHSLYTTLYTTLPNGLHYTWYSSLCTTLLYTPLYMIWYIKYYTPYVLYYK